MRITSFGLALILGGMAAAGCTTMDGNTDDDSTSSESAELAAKPSLIPSYTLHVSQDENTVDIHDNTLNVWASNPNPNGNDFAYLSGTSITASPFPTIDWGNCVQFLRWSGDCTGGTCNLIMNSDKSIHAVWGRLKGCSGN